VDKLTKYLVESILLSEGTNIKKIVGIYGGRFQPFGPHHYKTYKWLQKHCDDAYITTSAIKKPPRHPMNFKEKVRHMVKMGVPSSKIVQERTPYVAENVLKKYDSETTAVIYVFGEKDAGRLSGGKKKSGGAKYYQDYKKNKTDLKGYEEHGYFLTAPHISISVGGKEVSGTAMRELLGSSKIASKIDDSDREKLFKKMFGYFDKGVFNMMTNKFKKMYKEEVNEGWLEKGSEKDRELKLKITKLYSKAFKHMPNSPTQLKIRKEIEKLRNQLSEGVDLPIEIGDTVSMGKFKNKKVVVKTIGWNEKGDLLINGKSAMRMRIIKQPNIFDENLSEASTNVGYMADAGEPDTGYTSPGKKRVIGKGAQPDLWYKKGGYEQLQFPKADDPFGDDTNRRIATQRVTNPDIFVGATESDDFITTGVGEKGDNFVQSLHPDVILDFLQVIDLREILKEASTTNIGVGGNSQGVDDGPRYHYGNKNTYKKATEKLAKKFGWEVINYIIDDDIEIFDHKTEYPNGPVGDVSFAPSGVGTGKLDTRSERTHYTGHRAFRTYYNHITNVAEILGYKVLDYLGADLVSKHSLGIDDIVDDIPEETPENRQDIQEMVFSHEWWKKELLTEGGAYGHMAHPFDDKDLTFGDLKKIIEDGLGGTLNREDNVTEKLDGQNLMVSWIDGNLRVARNKGHIKNFGKTSLDANGIKSKFKGRGNIADAFNFAVKDLEKGIKGLSQKQKDKIFNEGQHWMNLEVMWPKSANVIDYDVATIVFHGALIYDEKGNVRGEVSGSARILAGMIEQINKHIGDKYSIGKPNFLDVPKHQNFNTLKPKFLSQLNKLKNTYALNDSDTLSMYHQSYWEEHIYNAAQQFGYTIPDEILIGLTKRWAFFDKSYKIPTIKKDITDEKFLEWVLKFDKQEHATQVKTNMRPFEVLFFEVGAEIMKNVSGFIAANPDSAVQGIKKRIDKAITDVKSGGDLKKLNRLKVQLDRLNAIGGLDSIVPSEGIVFKYKGNTYKFTGAFASVNQIVGLMTF